MRDVVCNSYYPMSARDGRHAVSRIRDRQQCMWWVQSIFGVWYRQFSTGWVFPIDANGNVKV